MADKDVQLDWTLYEIFKSFKNILHAQFVLSEKVNKSYQAYLAIFFFFFFFFFFAGGALERRI